jgi:16S rRNA (adenine(1408)-N(1))-methyltransferase
MIDRSVITALACDRAGVLVDLGTGDGRFVAHVARAQPDWLAIGIDACRENLREQSRRAPANGLYLIANALALPPDLAGIATHVTINFPWGSLLAGLLEGDSGLLAGMRMLAGEHLELEIRLNADALHEQGWELPAGAEQIARSLSDAGLVLHGRMAMDAPALRSIPSTWAKRLAYGRDPRGLALHMHGRTDESRPLSVISRLSLEPYAARA